MKLKTMSIILGVAAALCLCGGNLLAQDDKHAGPGGPPPEDRGTGGPAVRFTGNIDLAQFQHRLIEQTRTNLSVTNDEEWSVIQPLIQKVMDARRKVVVNGGGMVMRMGIGGLGGPPPGERGGYGPLAGDEQKALQRALDDKAPVGQVKDSLAKYRAARQEEQAKLQAKLEAAQADLKNVLSVRQEAQAVLMGLLP
jgi:hypothetical protein